MINIYDKNEKNFDNNGLVILSDCIKCEVVEELNGQYELEIEYPLDKRGKWQYLNEGNIIKASTPMGLQLFRIYYKKKILGKISCNARHIFYDLLDNFLEDCRPTNINGAGALENILNNTQYLNDFTGMSDIETTNTSYYIRKNPVQAILGDDENSFLNHWGGEIVRDNFDIKMLVARGKDRGVTIRYGKNLIGIEENLNLNDVVTRILPTGLKKDGNTILMLPEKYIDSKYIKNYSNPKVKEFHFQEAKVNIDDADEKIMTEQQVFNYLRKKTKKLFEINKIDVPKVNYQVNFIELSKTEEYKNYQVLERVFLGDIVTIKHEKLNIDIKAKMIKYRWNCLINRYIEIELGNFKENINSGFDSINDAINNISNVIKNNKSSLSKAIDKATKLLTNALGGYVIKHNGEILIMDTENEKTATKVWRWNLNGLGYSGTGINGPYRLAITMDGSICADFINTGKLTANLINGGTLILGGIDNTNGTMVLKDSNSKEVLQTSKESNGYYNARVLDSNGRVRARFGEYGAEQYGLGVYNKYGELVTSSDRPAAKNVNGVGIAGCNISLESIESGIIASANITSIDSSSKALYVSSASGFNVGDIVFVSEKYSPTKYSIINPHIVAIYGNKIIIDFKIYDDRKYYKICKLKRPIADLKISGGFVVTNNDKYIKINKKNTKITLGMTNWGDWDGFVWYVICLDINGNVHYYTAGTQASYYGINFIGDEAQLQTSSLPNFDVALKNRWIILGAILSGIPEGNNIFNPDIRFVHQVYQNGLFRKDAPMYINDDNKLCCNTTKIIKNNEYVDIDGYKYKTITIKLGERNKVVNYTLKIDSVALQGCVGIKDNYTGETLLFSAIGSGYSFLGEYLNKNIGGTDTKVLTKEITNNIGIADMYISEVNGRNLKIVLYNNSSSSKYVDFSIVGYAI